jgi:hypothetical protein
LLFNYLQVEEVKQIPVQSPSSRKPRVPVFYAMLSYDGRKFTKIFEEDKENTDQTNSISSRRKSLKLEGRVNSPLKITDPLPTSLSPKVALKTIGLYM